MIVMMMMMMIMMGSIKKWKNVSK